MKTDTRRHQRIEAKRQRIEAKRQRIARLSALIAKGRR